MFTNLTIIRRYYIDKWSNMLSNKKGKSVEDIKDNDKVSIIEEN